MTPALLQDIALRHLLHYRSWEKTPPLASALHLQHSFHHLVCFVS